MSGGGDVKGMKMAPASKPGGTPHAHGMVPTDGAYYKYQKGN